MIKTEILLQHLHQNVFNTDPLFYLDQHFYR